MSLPLSTTGRSSRTRLDLILRLPMYIVAPVLYDWRDNLSTVHINHDKESSFRQVIYLEINVKNGVSIFELCGK